MQTNVFYILSFYSYSTSMTWCNIYVQKEKFQREDNVNIGLTKEKAVTVLPAIGVQSHHHSDNSSVSPAVCPIIVQ